MSAIGKGRGRGFTDVREAPLRRPGQLTISKFYDLIHLIDDLSINDPVYCKKIDKIVQMIENSLKNNSLKDIFDDLHKHALEDRQFGIKLAIACSDPKIYTLDECNLRLILLQTLQKDYEERELIKKRSLTQFRNAISLMGRVYCKLKINGKPMDILSTPLLHYLRSLLDASEEEDIELVTIQILINGLKIFEQSSSEFEDFSIYVRQVLINRNLSAKSRAMLLFIIDSSNLCFTPLLGRMKEFYFNKLDGNLFNEIQNHVNSIVNSKILSNDVSGSHDFDEFRNMSEVENNYLSMAKALQEECDLGSVATEKSLVNMNIEKPSIPRAIRGVGAADGTKDRNMKKLSRGKKGKLTDGQVWSLKPNTSSKVWGHDDRFDKDYTQT